MPTPKYQVFISEKPIGFFDEDQIRKIATDNTLCYLWREGAQEGPFSVSQLRAMWESGHIKPDCHYRHTDEEQWTLITDLWHSWLFNPSSSEHAESATLLAKVVEEQQKTRKIVRGIAVAIGIFFLLYYIFGVKINIR